MGETAFFDSNAALGRPVWRPPGAPYDREGLLRELDRCRITRALVYHADGRLLDPRAANRRVLSEAPAVDRRLVAAAVWSPAPYQPGRDPARELDELLMAGVRAFRIFPLLHGLQLSDPELRAFLEALEERALPLWVDFDQFWYNFSQLGQHEQRAIDFGLVDRLAVEYPRLPLVLVGAFHNHLTQLFKLFDRRENLRVETSLFQGNGMIRYVCRRWGSSRLLFGTGLPFTAPGAARAALMYAEIEEAERKSIAAANLELLLGMPPTPTLPEEPGRSPLLIAADRGEKLPGLTIHDAHGHIGPAGFEGPLGLSLGPQDGDHLVARMNRLGIATVAVSSWELMGGDAPAGNRVAAEAAERHPGRILPYLVVNPNYPEDWEAEVARWFSPRRFLGLKPYPFTQQVPFSDPLFRPALELADRLRLPVLCHFGFEPLSGVSPEELERLAPRYPGARFLVAHAGASVRTARALIPLAREFDNIFLEINYTSVPFGMVSHLVREAGAGKVVFGTDTPMRDQSPILGWVVYDRLSDEERARVLGGNFFEIALRSFLPEG